MILQSLMEKIAVFAFMNNIFYKTPSYAFYWYTSEIPEGRHRISPFPANSGVEIWTIVLQNVASCRVRITPTYLSGTSIRMSVTCNSPWEIPKIIVEVIDNQANVPCQTTADDVFKAFNVSTTEAIKHCQKYLYTRLL